MESVCARSRCRWYADKLLVDGLIVTCVNVCCAVSLGLFCAIMFNACGSLYMQHIHGNHMLFRLDMHNDVS